MYPNAVFGEHLLPKERKDKEVRCVAMICDKGQAFSRPHRHGDTRRLVSFVLMDENKIRKT